LRAPPATSAQQLGNLISIKGDAMKTHLLNSTILLEKLTS
jgi:hypothetical protein